MSKKLWNLQKKNYFLIQICIPYIQKNIILKKVFLRNFFKILLYKVFYVKFFTWIKIRFFIEIMTNKKFYLSITKFEFQSKRKSLFWRNFFYGSVLLCHMSHLSNFISINWLKFWFLDTFTYSWIIV